MKKFAFTLMELLTAMAIIGITAALVAPALTNIMPDKTKMQVIKAYKVLADTTQDLLNDPAYYYDILVIPSQDDGYTSPVKREGLASYSNSKYYEFLLQKAGTNNEYNIKYNGPQKYYYLLSEKIELSEELKNNGGTYSFVTLDGVSYSFSGLSDFIIDGGGSTEQWPTIDLSTIDYTVTIDLNGEKGPNSLGSKNVKKPDRFMFHVDTYGKVTAHPEDKLTAQYLKTRTKFNNKKEDYKAAFGS